MLAFAVAPAAVTTGVLYAAATKQTVAFDFHHAYASGAHAVLAGDSPLPAADDPTLGDGTKYIYPPLTAYAVAPFALLPPTVGDWIFTAAMIACVLGALRLVGVRDWRVYGVVLLWPPVQVGIVNANVSVPIVLLVALAWRLRDTPLAGGLTAGAAAALKLLFWPLVLWVWATRGRGSGAVAAFGAAALVLGPWALIGFAGLAGYPELVRALESELGAVSYSLFAFLLDLGASAGVARGVSVVVALSVIAAGLVVGRRGDDRRSLTLVIAGALLGTPLVWMHYFSVLVVVLALARPVLSPLWLAPTVLWGLPMYYFDPTAWQAALVLGVLALIVGGCVLPSSAAVRALQAPGRDRAFLPGGAALVAFGIVAADEVPSGAVVGGCLLVAYAVSSHALDRHPLGGARAAQEALGGPSAGP